MFRDGDRVEVIAHKGKPLLGVVTSLKGTKLTMVADGGIGNFVGVASNFRPSLAPYEIPVGRPIAKPDRVEVTTKEGFTQAGIVSRVAAGKITMWVDGAEDKVISGPAKAFRFTATPLPIDFTRLKTVSLKKGDRIETDYKGKILLGIVRSVTGASVKMVLDGGKSEIGGSPGLFRKSDTPLPSDGPSPMDRWGMTDYKEHTRMSEETIAFNGTITLDGKPVIAAANRGCGGCNNYHQLPGAPQKAVDLFLSDAKTWAKVAGANNTLEVEDAWVSFTVYEKPYGVTASEKFAEQNKDYASLGISSDADEATVPKMG